LLTKPSNKPYSSADFSQNMLRLLKSLLKGLSSRRTRSRGPCGPHHKRPSCRLVYTHASVRQAVPLVTDPGSKLLCLPRLSHLRDPVDGPVRSAESPVLNPDSFRRPGADGGSRRASTKARPRRGADEVDQGVGQRGRGRGLAEAVAPKGFLVLPRRWVVEWTLSWIDQTGR